MNKEKQGFIQKLKLYPDFGTDLDGFDAGTLKIVVAVFGIAVVAGTAAAAGMLPEWVKVVLFAVGMCSTGVFCLVNLFGCLRKGRFFCESLPIVASCVSLFCTGLFIQPSIVFLIYTAVKIAENRVQRKQHVDAEELLSILPDTASVVLPGKQIIHRKPVHLRERDVVIVRKDDKVPVDGYVVDGMTTIDYSGVTHEVTSYAVRKGSSVIAGGINRGNPVLIRSICDYGASTAKRIISSFSSASVKKNRWGSLAEKLYNVFYPAAFLLAVLFGVVIPLITKNWITGIRKAAVLLICASPIGLTDILDLYVFSAVKRIFSSGAMIHDGSLLEKLASIETFVCNKTGTITEKEYSVTEIMPVGYDSEEPCGMDNPAANELLDYAVKAESVSVHPIAAAIRRYCGAPEKMSSEGLTTEEFPGKGVRAVFGNDIILCGNATLLFENGINCTVPNTFGAAIHVAVNNRYLGYLILVNELRPGNFDALEKLRSCGVRNFSLLSCDLRSVVRSIASSLNFSNYRTELTPEGKVGAVSYLMGTKPKGRYLAFLGNGRDELSCAARADISVASDVLFDPYTGSRLDVAIFSEGISRFPDVVSAAFSSMRFSVVSLAVNAALRTILLVLAMTGLNSAAVTVLLLSIASAVSLYFVGKI